MQRGRETAGRYALALAALLICSAAQAAGGVPNAGEISREIAEAESAGGLQGDVQISPDGRWVAFSVARGSIESNSVETRLVIKKTDGVGQEIALPAGAVVPRWSANGALLAVEIPATAKSTGNVALFEFHDGALHQVREIEIPKATPSSSPTYDATDVWSPSGKYLVIVAPVVDAGNASGLDPRRGVPDTAWQSHKPQRYALFVYDVAREHLRDLTPPAALIAPPRSGGIDWSPDEKTLVVSLERDGYGQGNSSKLVLLDVDSGQFTDLATEAGVNAHPVWSPDGKKILFGSQAGVPDYLGARPAVVDVRTKAIEYFSEIPRGEPVRWLADSRSFLWAYNDQMTSRVRRVGLEGGTRSRSAADHDESDTGLFFESNRSYSVDGKRVAYTRSAFAAPADVYVAHAGNDGRPNGSPTRLTHFAQAADLEKLVRVEEVSWPSPDGRFEIHGLLARPRAALTGPLPTVLYLTGGPSMVRRGFGGDLGGNDVRLALAAHGYAVLVPNTRGRNGYGDRFLFGIRDGHSYARVPLDDALSGVDYLVKQGVADPKRLGIAGHSYGGFLTAYALTRVQMFKAAVIHEAHLIDLTPYLYPQHLEARRLLERDLYGVEDPFDPSEFHRLIEESPGLHADSVHTPTLLLFGARSCAAGVGEPLFYEYQHFKVPSELYVYDEGHVFAKPAAVADSLEKTLEWMDRWVLASGPN